MEKSSSIQASVIIVSYNSRGYLERSIPGILADLKETYELILVDNASSDGGSVWVEKMFPSVRVIEAEKNLGFGGANNLGVKAARGEYVVFINPDTVVEPGWLDALLEKIKTGKEPLLVTSRIILIADPGIVNTCGNNVHISGITLCRGMGKAMTEFSETTYVNAVSGAAFAVSRRVFNELGGFDPDFFMYMEDTDLSLRARLAGIQTLFVPDSIVKHAYELRFGPLKTYFQERNRYLMLFKLYHWGTLVMLFPVLVLGEIVSWGFVILQEPARIMNKIRAYMWVIKNWKQILNKRHQVQSMRQVSDRTLINEMTSHLDISQVQPGWVGKTADIIFSSLFWILKLWVKCWVWW